MWNRKLCVNITEADPMPLEQQLEAVKYAGFDGFFVVWQKDIDMESLCQKAKELELDFQSLHAPWGKCRAMWREDEAAAREAVAELMTCVEICAQYRIPILVVHAIIGFAEPPATDMGIPRFDQVVNLAEEKGVQIALENTEGEDYLQLLLAHYKGRSSVGFCWDTGHELCYNHSQDLLALYGDQLICTHLNDNLGIKDFSGQISVTDDLHLLPFDGVANWQDIAMRLNRHHYSGPLTFELKIHNKHGRPENAPYAQMGYEAFLVEAYKRACRVAYLCMGK
ncbi:MAG: sugar phosphate isomerase/epimerase [Ruminococcaceae bacterium]|nr:sugar phosphate isomerase/epimerase [Oscillospiraceae bacterium]